MTVDPALRTGSGDGEETESIFSAFVLDGIPTPHVIRPTTEEACVEAVCRAGEEGCALVPWGGGTQMGQGNRLRAARWATLSTVHLTGLADYSPDDMVVSARAGMTLAALQAELAARGQFLPLDPPRPESTTLGGIVAANAQGLWRPAFGAPRDRLLALRAVTADGQVVKAGAKVVKNVAGYDLCKLFAGSWGTLGLLTEVTFKTNPLPEAQAHIVYAAPGPRAAVEAALAIHAARLQPVYLTVLSGAKAMLCVGLHGSRQAVAWQRHEIGRRLGEAGLQETEDGPTEEQARHFHLTSSAGMRARITARPTDMPLLVERLANHATALTCHVPTGLIDAALEGAGEVLREIAARIGTRMPASAACVWTQLPPDLKADMDVWGPTRADFALMQGIKAALDPNGMFSPGRFVGRL